MKGICKDGINTRDFDFEYYVSGMKNGKLYFKYMNVL